MSYFSGLVRNEWMKMSSKRQFPYYVIFLLIMIMGIAAVMRIFWPSTASEIGTVAYMDIMTSVSTALTMLFMVVVSAQIITDEYKDGTIKQLLIRPASRTTILMSKLVNLILILCAVMVIMTFIAWLSGIIFFSGEDSTSISVILQRVLLSLPTTLFYVVFAYMLGVITKSIGLSIAIPMITQSIVGPMTSMLANKSWYMLLIFPNLDWLPYFTDDALPPYTGASMGLSLFIYAAYMLIMLLITIGVFNKRDIQ